MTSERSAFAGTEPQLAHAFTPSRRRGGDWSAGEPPERDWKKLFLIAGLAVLSWVATYVGMLELIEANIGVVPLVHKVIIGFSVAMLMLMVVWLLDQLFAPIGFFTRLLYLAGYLFLSIISVGFGFGFYWKVLESRGEASRSAEGAIGSVQTALFGAATRLDQLQTTLEQLRVISAQKAEQERNAGTSCPNSRPGDGPRRKLREDDAQRFAFAAEFVKARGTQVKGNMTALDGDLARIAKDDRSLVDAKSGTRNEFMKGLGRKLDQTVTGYNALRTDPQLRQMRVDLAERADRTTFTDTRGGTYACPDPQLQAVLKGVVRAIDQLPELERPKVAAVEGSEATVEAFRRLSASFVGLLTFKLPPSADEIRHLQQKAIQSVEAPSAARTSVSEQQPGLSKRDYVPLAIAVFVDLCLLLVSMGRPVNRLNGLLPKMRAAERGPVYQILSRFSDIHNDADVRQKFELFRHVVFDFNGDYYVAVPLDAPRSLPEDQRKELQLEAHLLANLFSSFEKEKIFSRVLMPLLPTSQIQKKLARQGSKFAETDAFRVYRFRDGAWSEIILGAVMGAAKRVEAEKERQSGAPREPDPHELPMPAARPAPAPMDPAGVRPEPVIPTRPSVVNDPPVRRAGRSDVILPYPIRRTAQARRTESEADPPTSAAFGPYARHVRRSGGSAEAVNAVANAAEPASSSPAPATDLRAATEIVVVAPARDAAAVASIHRIAEALSEAAALEAKRPAQDEDGINEGAELENVEAEGQDAEGPEIERIDALAISARFRPARPAE